MSYISLNAGLVVEQNLKALYRDVNLTADEKNYISDNQDKNIEAIKKASERYTSNLSKFTNQEKNVVSFVLTKNHEIKDLRFLNRSNKRDIDNLTKQIVENTKFIPVKDDLQMRFIFIYELARKNVVLSNSKKDSVSEDSTILRGTTRFEYSSNEYVRTFETSQDGFINANAAPSMCASFQLLTSQNQDVMTGLLFRPWSFNKAIPKGKYKLLIKVQRTCDVHLDYL
jgi:hypothetical protein